MPNYATITNMKVNKKILPTEIKVKIIPEKGGYFAYLPEYDVFTEADSPLELFFNVNDLIYTFFDVPKNKQKKVHFFPQRPSNKFVETKSLLFQQSVVSTTPLVILQ